MSARVPGQRPLRLKPFKHDADRARPDQPIARRCSVTYRTRMSPRSTARKVPVEVAIVGCPRRSSPIGALSGVRSTSRSGSIIRCCGCGSVGLLGLIQLTNQARTLTTPTRMPTATMPTDWTKVRHRHRRPAPRLETPEPGEIVAGVGIGLVPRPVQLGEQH